MFAPSLERAPFFTKTARSDITLTPQWRNQCIDIMTSFSGGHALRCRKYTLNDGGVTEAASVEHIIPCSFLAGIPFARGWRARCPLLQTFRGFCLLSRCVTITKSGVQQLILPGNLASEGSPVGVFRPNIQRVVPLPNKAMAFAPE